MSNKPLPDALYVGVQNDTLYILDGRPCATGDCPPHEDGPNPLATMAGSSQWDIELVDALVEAYNGRARLAAERDSPKEVAALRAEVDRLRTEMAEVESAVCEYADSAEHGGTPAEVAADMWDRIRRLEQLLSERHAERDEARAERDRLRTEQNRADELDPPSGRQGYAAERWA